MDCRTRFVEGLKSRRMAIDGGWGWVIVGCSFYYHAFVSSPIYTLSVFYSNWVEDFDAGRGITSLAVTLCMTLGMVSSPIVASLCARYGYRPVVITGALFSSAGFFCSCFVTSVYALIFCIGIIAGLGKGMTYLPNIAIVAQYFTKKRPLAVGIGTCGVGFGAFLFPPLFIWLEEQYTWRGSMLIISGSILNMVVCGALMRPLKDEDQRDSEVEEQAENTRLTRSKENVGAKNKPFSNGVCHNVENSEFINRLCSKSSINQEMLEVGNANQSNGSEIKLKLSSGLELAEVVSIEPLIDKKVVCRSSDMQISNSHGDVSSVRKACMNIGGSVQHLQTPAVNGLKAPYQSSSVMELRSRTSNGANLHHKCSCGNVSASHTNKMNGAKSKNTLLGNSHVDILLTNSLFDLEKVDKKRQQSLLQINHLRKEASSSLLGSQSSALHRLNFHTKDVISHSSITSPETHTMSHLEKKSSLCSNCSAGIFSQISLQLSILRNPYFAIFAFSNFLTCFTYLMPVVYMVDRAVDLGVDRTRAALALSMYGAGNIIGRLMLGWIADLTCGSVIAGAISLLVCGVSTCLSPLCGTNVLLHGAYGLIFGIFIGGYVTLTPLILVELLGLKLVNQSYGLILVFQAVGFIVGTPLAGWIFDSTQSYSVSFVIHGAVIGVAGLLLIPLKCAGVQQIGDDDDYDDDCDDDMADNIIVVDTEDDISNIYNYNKNDNGSLCVASCNGEETKEVINMNGHNTVPYSS